MTSTRRSPVLGLALAFWIGSALASDATSPRALDAPLRPLVRPVFVVDKTNPYSEEFGRLTWGQSMKSKYEAVLKERTRLVEAGETDGLRTAYLAEYYLNVMLLAGRWKPPNLETAMREAVEIRMSLPETDPAEFTRAIGRLGLALEARGRFEEALEYYRQAAERPRPEPPEAKQIDSKRRDRHAPRRSTRLAALQIRMGHYTAARRTLDDVIAQGNSPGPVSALLLGLGDYHEAKLLLEKFAVESTESANPTHGAWRRHNLAVVQTILGDHRAAMDSIDEALRRIDHFYDEQHPLHAQMAYTRAAILARAGEIQAAEALLRRTLANQNDWLAPEHPDLALTNLALANVLVRQGRIDEADPCLRRSRESLDRMPDDFPSRSDLYAAIAVADYLDGRHEQAVDHSIEASRLGRRRFLSMAPEISEREALLLRSELDAHLDVAHSVLASRFESASLPDIMNVWAEVAHDRVLVLNEAVARRRPAWTAGGRLGEEWFRHRDNLSRFVMRHVEIDDAGCHDDAIRDLRKTMERVEREVAATNLSNRNASTPAALPLNRLVERLADGAALVSFVRYDRVVLRPSGPDDASRRIPESVPSYLAYTYVAGSGAAHVVPLGDAERIDDLVERWAASLSVDPRARSAATASTLEQSRSVRRAVWDPVARVLGDTREVFLVPDAGLHLLNPFALADEDGRYLVESGPEIHLLAAESDLEGGRRAPTAESLLAVGSPDFGIRGLTPQDPHGIEILEFEPLPGAKRETRDIAEIWRRGRGQDTGAVSVLTGKQASEENVERLAGQHTVIHLATHAFSFLDRCSAALPDRDERLRGSLQRSAAGPFPLTGLALEAANRRHQSPSEPDDGMLTSAEIASLDLRGVDLVSLSACETGLGLNYPGEGVLGLRRAFRTAGASQVLATLWPVADADARAWMRAFYTRYVRGDSASRSARAASQELITRARERGRQLDPHHWAAFVVVGKPLDTLRRQATTRSFE